MDLVTQLGSYRPFRVLVIGDFMLDEAVYGAAERLSPDAPVPVLQASRTEVRPGGAGNVALCLQALLGQVVCVGVVGADEAGATLRTALESAGCDTSGIVADAERPTTIKRSLVGLAQHRHPQKMFRLDIESRAPLGAAVRDRIVERVEALLPETDIACIEDYDKGVCDAALCQAVIERCRSAGVEVLVDPAAIEDYTKYRGATAITPNRSEAERATGLDTPLDASELHNSRLAAKLGSALDLDAVVLTLDRHGALLEERGGKPVLVPTVARSVYDVSGAGDVVLAALAGGRANGLGWLDAVRFANAAAGLEVEVFGCQPIPLASVQREVLRLERPLEGKVRDLEALRVELAVHRNAGHRIVFTNGCFDVIHAGHVVYLRDARAQGDVLVVAVNDDAGVRTLKGEGRPVYACDDRMLILAELECVNYVIPFAEPTVSALLDALRPDLYVKGGDYRPEEIAEHDLVRELGIELRVLAHRPGLSSTSVIERTR